MARRPYILQTGMGVDVHGVDATTAALPVGQVSVRAEPGGMLAETGTSGDPMRVALAAVLLSIDDEQAPGS